MITDTLGRGIQLLTRMLPSLSLFIRPRFPLPVDFPFSRSLRSSILCPLPQRAYCSRGPPPAAAGATELLGERARASPLSSPIYLFLRLRRPLARPQAGGRPVGQPTARHAPHTRSPRERPFAAPFFTPSFPHRLHSLSAAGPPLPVAAAAAQGHMVRTPWGEALSLKASRRMAAHPARPGQAGRSRAVGQTAFLPGARRVVVFV